MNRQELIDYCLSLPGVYEDYPFHDINEPGKWAAMRHRVNTKCFAFVYERNDKLCINLKCDPFEADFLRQAYMDVTPAYHMNKEHWNTVIPGGDVPNDVIIHMIEQSYNLIKPKGRERRHDK